MTASEVAAKAAVGPLIRGYQAPLAARQLRVVYVWDADYPWDVRTEKLCATLASAGHDVHIVARNRAWRPREERLPEGTVHRMRPWRWAGRRLDGNLGFPTFFSPRWRALLDDTIRHVRPDVIIGRDLPLAPTTLWAARRHRIPAILDIAEHYPGMIQMIYDARRQRPIDYLVRNPAAVAVVERYAVTRADRVLVVAEEMAERLSGMGVPADRIDVVSNTPPRALAERTSPRQATASGQPLSLVYLGILEIVRGLAELIDAVAILRERGMLIRLIIIGSGRDYDLFTARARARGLTDSDVQFLGFVDHGPALEIVGSADIGVLPHHVNDALNVTIPNKLFDYMALGLPVITSDAVPPARIVRETGAGEVFPSGDPKALADAVAALASPEVRRVCGAAGRQAILDRYNWEHDTQALLRAVEQAATRGTRWIRN